jgi:putative ABC transport system ATP-binding protein
MSLHDRPAGCPSDRHPLALECRQLRKTYGERTVLSGIDLRLGAGDYVAIMGESGVGKSTLLNLIAGLDAAEGGDLLIDGIAVNALDDAAATRLRRQKLGFIFQAFHLLPHLNLMQNVALPLLLNGLPVDRANEMLAAVGLAGREQDFPRQLSGGEMQRVAIARALVHRPRLLLADEPTGNLDPETADDILGLLKSEIRASGASAVIVTHSPVAAAGADRVLLLTRDGLRERERPTPGAQ